MYSKNIFAAGALLSVVAAVPMKRDVVMYTETAVDIVTVPVTTTVWVNPGQAVPTGSHSHYGHHHTITSHVQSTVTVPSAPASTPSSVETSAAAPAPSSSEAPSSSSVAVAPTTPSTTAYVAPITSSTTEYVAPTPSSTYVAPTTSTTEAAAPSATTYSSSGSGSDLSGAAAPGTSYTGDFTWYQDGLGACGLTNGPSDHIVAIAESLFDQYTPSSGNPNDNPLCGKTVTLTGVDGSAYPATIVDRCTGCQEADLDLSEDFFNTVTDNGNGRVHNMSWKFD